MRICLVGSTHPCHNPRLVREADTLAQLGHDVRVVAPSFMPELAELDRRLMAKRIWRLQLVQEAGKSFFARLGSAGMRLRRRLARASFALTRNARLADYASCTHGPELAALTVSEPADWFIAHTQSVLPAAAAAARKTGARLGLDCEDLLTRNDDPADAAIVGAIEQRYLSRCEYVSVPSPSIASCLRQEYGIGPTVLYNVFPVHLAKGLVAPKQRQKSARLRLHWVGQTIGRGRGLEEAVEAASLLNDSAELHVRGRLAIGQASFLQELERRFQISIKLHPVVPHDELLANMDQFDVGLALERAGDRNAALTVSNKLFLYLLAGLAVAATDTAGQGEILEQIPSAGFLYPAGKAEILAERLQGWASDHSALLAAKQAAWDAARARFCWDIEQAKFLRLLGLLDSPAEPVYGASLTAHK